jgi:uptake hydrogenase large subunit
VAIEGALSVRLTIARDRDAVASVGIVSTRPARAARALAGRSDDDVLRLVPLLFPVCGVAQTVACTRAIRAARGTRNDARCEDARNLLCQAEAVVAHTWQLAISWPEAAQVPSDIGIVRTARTAFTTLCAALFEGGSVQRPLRAQPAWAEARAAVTQLCDALEHLTAGDVRLFDTVRDASSAAFGAADTNTVAALDVTKVGALLAADPDWAEHPELDGEPVDVSAYARHRGNEAVRLAEELHGPGLLARLLARHAEAESGARRLRESFAAFERGGGDLSSGPPACSVDGLGVGHADTARGPLVYAVRVAPSAGAVEDVRVVAPTNWTFHPRGALHRALVGASAGLELARNAAWLVLALDPCVPCAIEVHHA